MNLKHNYKLFPFSKTGNNKILKYDIVFFNSYDSLAILTIVTRLLQLL